MQTVRGSVQRDLYILQKRPMYVAKEAYGHRHGTVTDTNIMQALRRILNPQVTPLPAPPRPPTNTPHQGRSQGADQSAQRG